MSSCYSTQTNSGPFQLIAQRLNSHGGRIGPAVRISEASDVAARVNNEDPRVLWNARAANYVVLWRRYRLSNSMANIVEGLYGMILDPSLRILKSATLIQSFARTENVLRQSFVRDLAIHPITGRIMVAYVQAAPDFFTTSKLFFYLANLDASLVGIRPASFIKIKQTSVRDGFDMQIAFQPNGNGFVVYADVSNVRLRKIHLAGKLTGPALPAFRPPLSNVKLSSLALEASTGAHGVRFVLLGVRDSFNTAVQRGLWAQILTADGTPAGPPNLITALNDYAVGTVLSVLPDPLSSANHRFVAVYEEGIVTSTGLTNTGLNLILLRLNFPV